MASGTITTRDLSDTNQIGIGQLVGLATRCILITFVFVVSTGPLIRRLIKTAASDLVAYCVGTLWLAGDLLPCLALLVLIHDVLVVRKKDDSELFSYRGRAVTLLEAIVHVIVTLYLVDLVLACTCAIKQTATATNQSNACLELLTNYRYVFFHIQIALALLYWIKPWRIANLDLRVMLTNSERFYLLALKMTRAQLSLLNRVSQSLVSRFVSDPIPAETSEESFRASGQVVESRKRETKAKKESTSCSCTRAKTIEPRPPQSSSQTRKRSQIADRKAPRSSAGSSKGTTTKKRATKAKAKPRRATVSRRQVVRKLRDNKSKSNRRCTTIASHTTTATAANCNGLKRRNARSSRAGTSRRKPKRQSSSAIRRSTARFVHVVEW